MDIKEALKGIAQTIDERIENLERQLADTKRYLVDDIKSSSMDSYGNLYEKLIGQQARLNELRTLRESTKFYLASVKSTNET